MDGPSNDVLPSDIIMEILLRLPVKTLLRFKCVCKDWYALIGSQSFINQHFGHESNQEHLLVPHYRPKEDLYSFALCVDEMLSGYEDPDHLLMPRGVAAVWGPLNGIFCVASKSGRVALLNPAMRQFQPLPLHPLGKSSSYEYFRGFGLDPLSGDYKFVSIQYFWDEELNASNYNPVISVYNSGRDSWRYFEDVDLLNSMLWVSRGLSNAYLNGVYYWLTCDGDANDAIIAFDMSSDEFREIKIPDCISTSKRNLDLTRIGDSIALLSYDCYEIDKCIDVWVMKNEGCWIKSSTFGPFPDQGGSWPVGFWKNQLLLETTTEVLTVYNASTQKLTTVEARKKENDIFRDWAFTYKESLVSIKREGDNCKYWDASSDFVKDFFK